ncbi:hypothetical protein ACLQ8Z_03410 [Bordetella hinzii]|uniref:hypothetical protein n=1 Tax=Bordetella hinzii TaxID=103855 RepID=UPI0039FDC28E
MQTDRELLELAAKAAGIDYLVWTPGTSPIVPAERRIGGQMHWNPIHDDGDALRLAVKLRISIDHNHSADHQRWVSADRNGCEGCYSPVSAVEDEFEESERPAATRRAIVRAAAEIGAKMGEE